MSNYTTMFNQVSERRRQSLSFVGQDRRKIIEDAETQAAHDANTRAFLSRVQDIEDIKQIA
jgi:hypothetical protein